MSAFLQHVNPISGMVEWIVQPEDYDYHQEVARSAYADMLHDHDRNTKYYKGLELAIGQLHRAGKKAIVLDIGTGTGLLSMMAAKLGAETIYACEGFKPMADCAAKVIERNGFQNQIKLLPKRSTDLQVGEGKDLTTRANILVTEVFDTELIGEGAIGTYNHAHEFLLEPDSMVIPTKATYFAQVVHCPIVSSWNNLHPIIFPTGTTINFPQRIENCAGVPSVHDVQLSEIKEHQFRKLSEPIVVFEFDWADGKNRLLENDFSTFNFEAKSTGTSTAIFSWWDLQMSSLLDHHVSSNVITMKPKWAGNQYFWRDHWMQAIYYNPRPIQIEKTQHYTIQSFHDEYSFWFNVMDRIQETSIAELPRRPVCTCGIHVGLGRSRIGLFNDEDRRKKFFNMLSPLVTTKTVCIVLSEGSSLPFLLAGLGAGKVIVRESNIILRGVMEKLIKELGYIEQILLVDDFNLDHLQDIQIDLVVGDPIFHHSVLPWHNLTFWYQLQHLKLKLSPEVKILPSKGTLKGLIVNYEDLWKIRSDVGKVCNGDFDLTDFDVLIQDSATISDNMIDAVALWEYPATACSSVFNILTFDFESKVDNLSEVCQIPILGKPNGISLWMEWKFEDKQNSSSQIVSTGPVKNSDDLVFNELIEWDVNSKQGVYFLQNTNSPSTYLNFEKFQIVMKKSKSFAINWEHSTAMFLIRQTSAHCYTVLVGEDRYLGRIWFRVGKTALFFSTMQMGNQYDQFFELLRKLESQMI